MGRVIFNVAAKTHTEDAFSSVTSSILHEFVHVLGFDRMLFESYLDWQTGSPYRQPITQETTYHPARGKTLLITTPRATLWARRHFSCEGIAGVQLENEGSDSSRGSHWERSVFYDELMTATTLGTTKVLSGLTFSLLEDMGWYEVNGLWNDTLSFGQGKGCAFYEEVCYSAAKFGEFCPADRGSRQVCSPDGAKKAICMSKGTFADGCGIAVPYEECSNSGCFHSSLASALRTRPQLTHCLAYRCVSGHSLVVESESHKVTCYAGETNKTYYGLFGWFECPDLAVACRKGQPACPNRCSHRGICMGGLCHCAEGSAGPDCSIDQCAPDQFALGVTCVEACPAGLFPNQFDRTCQQCHGSCAECE